MKVPEFKDTRNRFLTQFSIDFDDDDDSVFMKNGNLKQSPKFQKKDGVLMM